MHHVSQYPKRCKIAAFLGLILVMIRCWSTVERSQECSTMSWTTLWFPTVVIYNSSHLEALDYWLLFLCDNRHALQLIAASNAVIMCA